MIKREIKEHFSKYVLREMEERELKHWYVAYYADTCEPFLRSCLKLKNLPRVDSLVLIAELLECTVNDLLGFDHVEVPEHEGYFSPGAYSKPIVNYFIDQLTARGLDVSRLYFDEPTSREIFASCLRVCKLPSTDIFLQVCENLNCTPSELLGY